MSIGSFIKKATSSITGILRKEEKPSGSVDVKIGGSGTINTPSGGYTYTPSTGTLQTPQGGMSVPSQSSASNIVSGYRGSSGGGSSGSSSSGGGTSSGGVSSLESEPTKSTGTSSTSTKQKTTKTPDVLKPSSSTFSFKDYASNYGQAEDKKKTSNLNFYNAPGDLGINPFYEKGTSTNLAQTGEFKVYSPGTIYSFNEGSAGKNKFGGEVPLISYQTVQEDFSTRPSTKEEIFTLRGYQNALTLENTQGSRGKLKEFFGETKGKINIMSNEEIVTPGEINSFKSFSSKGGKVGELIGGTIADLIPTTKGQLIETGVSLGIGLGAGTLFQGASIGLSKIPKVGSIATKGFRLTSLGAGTYLTGAYAVSKVGQIAITPDYFEKGQIIGGGLRETLAFGFGFKGGEKLVSKLQGLYLTRGRMDLPLEKLTREEVILGKQSFPTAPPETHLRLFKETITRVPELTQGKAGGFHVTPEKFFGKGKDIVPQAGTSELPGLYVSSEASIHFSGVSGKSGKQPLNFKKMFQDFLKVGEPGIAFLKPEGFREVRFRRDPEWSAKVIGKGGGKITLLRTGEAKFPYKFIEPAKGGFIDIPKMKTEIEGIARVDAGKYLYESGKYYTTIKGVRVPIDVYTSENIKLNTAFENVRGKGKFKPESYSLPSSSKFLPSLFYSSGKGSSSNLGSSLKISSKLYNSYLPKSSSIFGYSKKGFSSLGKSSGKSSSFYSGFGSGSGGGSSTGGNYNLPKTSNYPLSFKLPQMKMMEKANLLTAEREFKNTPTFYNVLGKDLGLKQLSGGYENPFKTGVKLPTTFLTKVKRRKVKI